MPKPPRPRTKPTRKPERRPTRAPAPPVDAAPARAHRQVFTVFRGEATKVLSLGPVPKGQRSRLVALAALADICALAASKGDKRRAARVERLMQAVVRLGPVAPATR